MNSHLFVLEDDERRRQAMSAVWCERHPGHPIVFFATAAEAIRHLGNHWSDVLVASLDHDLEIIEGAGDVRYDAGTGRDVADFLAETASAFPVVVGSTNMPAAVGMEETLRDSGWPVERVTPYGDLEWIAEAWYPAVRRMIRTSVAPAPTAGADPV